jgi:hypothetical protein
MPDLEVAENPSLQRKHWRTERIGWCVMALTVLAETLGAFGGGPLSKATAGSDGPLTLEYERLSRMTRSTSLRVHVDPAAAAGGEVRIWLGRGYLNGVDVERITPPPLGVQVGTNRQTNMFGTRHVSGPLEITFGLRPRAIGTLRGEAGLDGGAPIRFSQFIFP